MEILGGISMDVYTRGRESVPTRDELVGRARALLPGLRERAARSEADRRIPRESIDEIVAAGLGRALQPRRFGGFELGHAAAFDIAAEIGSACTSTGWCTSLLNIHDWWLACFPEEAQHDVWRDTPNQNIAAMVYPTGKAKPVDGGYRLTGRWSWVSGIDHSHWAIVAALVIPEAGPPHVRQFLLPRSDYTVVDTWHNAGLRGTGSNDMTVDDVFVASHRTLPMDDFREGITEGGRSNGNPIYRVPMIAAFPHALCGPALGAARGALNEWLEWTRTRTATASGDAIAETVPAQIRVSQVEAEIDAAELLIRRNIALVEQDEPIDLATRARSFSSYSFAVHALVRAVDSLVAGSGARGMVESNPLQRFWRDIHAASVHIGLSTELSGQLRGRALLGVPRDPKARMY
jgi:3-hydroxy-9,10-secoandrosta-1,3,5(10)-triene-9,17-dione monooxygenase